MIQHIYSIYDSAAEAYITPFFLPSDPVAIRAFSGCINDPTHQFGRHPHDYTLFLLGSWDDSNAKATIDPPIALGNGVEFITQKKLNLEPQFPQMESNQK